jgi:hypothetical protein
MATLSITAPINEDPKAAALGRIPKAVLALCHTRGQFVALKTSRNLKMKKGYEPVLKVSEFTVRVGIDHENQARVKEVREEGKEASGLVGREWVHFPYILMTTHNKALFRCYPVSAEVGSGVRSVKFFRGGIEITKEEAAVGAYAGEFAEKDEAPTGFDVNIDNITHINGKCIKDIGLEVAE